MGASAGIEEEEIVDIIDEGESDMQQEDVSQEISQDTRERVEQEQGGDQSEDGGDDDGPNLSPLPPDLVDYVVEQVTETALDEYEETIEDALEDDDDDDDESAELETTSFDMANGQSTLINAPAEGRDRTLLVDAGSNTRIATTPWSEYREELADQLETNSDGEYVIDHLVVSHNHTDHISYVDDILDNDTIIVRNLYFNGLRNGIGAEDDLDSAASSSTSTTVLREGDQVTVGEATVDVLNPDSAADGVGDNPSPAVMDRNSIVLHVQHDSGDILTTGDIRGSREESLTEDFGSQLSSVDILMASHHGTSSSTESVVTDQLLDAISPQTVIISNSNQMSTSRTDRYAPDCAVFDRTGDRNLPVYWTAIHGEIQFTGDSFSGSEAESGLSDPDELQSRLPYSC
jgi:beta-lactamase superfamily II metal-dependent hydrolase